MPSLLSRIFLTGVMLLCAGAVSAVSLTEDTIRYRDIGGSETYDLYELNKSSGASYLMRGRGTSTNSILHLQWYNNSGLVVTSPGEGLIREVKIKFNSQHFLQSYMEERRVSIYSSEVPYTSVDELYQADPPGELLGEFGTEENITLTLDKPAAYIGISHSDRIIKINQVIVVWDADAGEGEQCEPPVIEPADGSPVLDNMQMELSADSPLRRIYYTTDGSTPTAETATLYTGPVNIEDLMPADASTLTVKAIACFGKMDPSEVATAEWHRFAEGDVLDFELITDVSQLRNGDRVTLVGTVMPDLDDYWRRYALTVDTHGSPCGLLITSEADGPNLSSSKQMAAYTLTSSAVEVLTLTKVGTSGWSIADSQGRRLWTDGATGRICRGSAPSGRDLATITVADTRHTLIEFPADESDSRGIRFEDATRRFVASAYNSNERIRPYLYRLTGVRRAVRGLGDVTGLEAATPVQVMTPSVVQLVCGERVYLSDGSGGWTLMWLDADRISKLGIRAGTVIESGWRGSVGTAADGCATIEPEVATLTDCWDDPAWSLSTRTVGLVSADDLLAAPESEIVTIAEVMVYQDVLPTAMGSTYQLGVRGVPVYFRSELAAPSPEPVTRGLYEVTAVVGPLIASGRQEVLSRADECTATGGSVIASPRQEVQSRADEGASAAQRYYYPLQYTLLTDCPTSATAAAADSLSGPTLYYTLDGVLCSRRPLPPGFYIRLTPGAPARPVLIPR